MAIGPLTLPLSAHGDDSIHIQGSRAARGRMSAFADGARSARALLQSGALASARSCRCATPHPASP